MVIPAPRETRVPAGALAAAAAVVVLQLAVAARDGIFRDELYYLACADHLAWGYVDHPPLSIGILWLVRALLGESVFALRLVPALLNGGLVLLAAVLAREMGGTRLAQGLAALSVAVVPQYLGIHGFYSMNAFDLTFWAAAAWLVLRLVKTDEPRLWLALGGLLGVALLNKISPLFFGAGLAAGILATPLRRHLRGPYPWLGGALALAVLSPHLLWQAREGWPTLEFIRNAQASKITPLGPLVFAASQLVEIHPLNAPLWLAGLLWLLAGEGGRRFRVLGIVYLVAFAIMAVQNSKPYYLGPAYPMLLAAGAVVLPRRLGERKLAAVGVIAVFVAGGLATAPMAVPVLPVEHFLAYQRWLGFARTPDERHTMGPLPQHFADRHGWKEMAEATIAVAEGLSAGERGRLLIVTANYGEAGAIRYFGRGRVPAAVSQHNSYYLWGPGAATADVVIAVGLPEEVLRRAFEEVTPAARVVAPYAMPYETRHPIHVCRRLRLPLEEAWRRGKHYD